MAELDGLGVELEKLSELESIREEWQLQVEAQDEVRGWCLFVLRCCTGVRAGQRTASSQLASGRAATRLRRCCLRAKLRLPACRWLLLLLLLLQVEKLLRNTPSLPAS
jgi:hypothetical protein